MIWDTPIQMSHTVLCRICRMGCKLHQAANVFAD